MDEQTIQEQSKSGTDYEPLVPPANTLDNLLDSSLQAFGLRGCNEIETIASKHGKSSKTNGEWSIGILQTSADELEGPLAELLARKRLRDGGQGHRSPLLLRLRVAPHRKTAIPSSPPAPPLSWEFAGFGWNGG